MLPWELSKEYDAHDSTNAGEGHDASASQPATANLPRSCGLCRKRSVGKSASLVSWPCHCLPCGRATVSPGVVVKWHRVLFVRPEQLSSVWMRDGARFTGTRSQVVEGAVDAGRFGQHARRDPRVEADAAESPPVAGSVAFHHGAGVAAHAKEFQPCRHSHTGTG